MNYSQDANDNDKNSKHKRKRKRKNSAGVIFLRVFLIVAVVCCFAVGGGLLGAYLGIIESAPPLNTVDLVPESYTSIIYDSSGNEIDKLHGEENREYVKLEFIPRDLQNAIVAIEDERFYEHNGIDFRGIMRALVVNIQSGDATQGASTITQQLVKNEALSKDKTIKRKLQEQYLAVKFEKDLETKLGSKEKAKNYILELYLNTISLNHGLNGVESASKFYYGKEVGELTLAECASIAGITKNPSAYSPVSNPTKNKERQMLVLDKMLKLGYINQGQYNVAKAEDIYSKIVGSKTEETDTVSFHSYFIDQLVVDIADDLVEQKGMSKQQAYDMIYSGGLQIHSTVDMNMQSIMEESYKNDELFPPKGNTLDATYTISILNKSTQEQTHHSKKATVTTQEEAEAFAQSVRDELLNSSNEMVLDNLSVVESLQSAMVIMDYRTGEVKALVGGRGEKKGDLVFNRATQALRQPGSCFKVLAAYAPAIDLDLVSPGTVIMDEPYTVNGWSPKNWYGGKFRGAQTVRQGIKDSLNILAAKTYVNVGAEKAFEYLENFGFTTLIRSEEINGSIKSDLGPATSLGGITHGISVLELTAAYGAIANNGVYLKPSCYSQVIDHDGKVLLNNDPEQKRVIKETTAYMLTDMMEDVVTGGGTGGLARFNKVKMPIAGKTGTTSDDVDLTFAGYTPYYVAGIWLGYDTPKTIQYKKSYHLLLWSDVMEKIHEGLEYKKFVQPAGIVTKSFCSASGGIPIPGVCEGDYYGNGIASDISASDFGTSQTCSYHKSFKVDLSTGKIANEYCPTDKVSNVVLAIDPDSGSISNLPNPMPEGKVEIDINATCTVHNINTAQEKSPDEGVIGGNDVIPPMYDENGNELAPPVIPTPGSSSNSNSGNGDSGNNGSGNSGSENSGSENSGSGNSGSGNNVITPPTTTPTDPVTPPATIPQTPTDTSVNEAPPLGTSGDDLFIPD